METLIWLLSTIAVSGFMAYKRASLSTFTFAVAVLFVAGTLLDIIGLVSWLLFAFIALPLNIASFRKQYISAPLLAMFKKIMPEMSRTEKEAIDAGTTWWEADLFRGAPDWQKLHNYPQPRLSAEEQAFLDGPVEEVCRMVDDWDTTHSRADLSPEIWQYLKDNKFFAMIIKKEYGGLEFSAFAQSRVLQKLTGGIGIDINNLNQFQFQQLCQLLETTAEGRELRNQLFKALRSKKSRDSDVIFDWDEFMTFE